MRKAELRGPRGLSLHVEIPDSRCERARGLLGRDHLEPSRALLFERARSVHTLGMRFPLTVAFLDGDLRVIAVKRMRPGRIAAPRRHVRGVLECGDDIDLRLGDRLVLVDNPAEARLYTLSLSPKGRPAPIV